MASNINFESINIDFPIAGVAQSSQGFRDNYGIIKNSLSSAKSEIEDLQQAIEDFQLPPDIIDQLLTIEDLIAYLVDNNYLTQSDLIAYLVDNNYLTQSDLIAYLVDNEYLTRSEILELLSQLNVDIGISDSIITTAAPTTTTVKTSVLTLTDSSLIENFKVGQPIRVFGAGSTQTNLQSPVLSSVIKNGEVDGLTTVEYKICQFEFSTGRFSGPSSTVSQTVNIDLFNLINNLRLNFTRTSSGNGILVYRKTGNTLFELISILGPKDLGTSLSGGFVDYITFDYNPWSLKKSTTNSYESSTGTIHFPVTAPAAGSLGWIDTVIQSVNTETSRITLASEFFFKSQVTLVQDDTADLQAKIDEAVQNNQNILKVPSRIHYVSSIIVPDNFSIIGDSKQTLIKKLPWSSTSIRTNKLFKSLEGTAQNSISIEDMRIDGNMQNQYLLDESTDESINYLIDLRGNDITFQNLIIENVIGGGISSRESTKLTVSTSRISNAGMTDRYSYSPLFADLCNEIIISNNIMTNFSESVDLSLTNIGTVIGNIVNNCGSGILIFASTKLVSSPNLIIGPAGEYIPGPDLYNSEFDSVNIVIERNITFISDVYVYQQNGQLVDLSANNGRLEYKVNKLRKVDNVEEIGDEILISGSPPISALFGVSLVAGQFKFAITADKTTILKTTYSYSTLKISDPNHIGLIYRVIFVEDVEGPSVDPTLEPTILISSGKTYYTIRLATFNNLSVGFKVKLADHGGDSQLANISGTINLLVSTTNECVIEYPFEAAQAGTGGTLLIEDTTVLAKGKIQ